MLQQPHDKTNYLVRFYDKSDLWYVYQHSDTERVKLTFILFRAWIPPDMLRLLGEIDGEAHRFHADATPRLNDWFVELDQDMLATNSRRQKWKSGAIRAECRHSYK